MTLKCLDSFISLSVMWWEDETDFLASGPALPFWSGDVGTSKASWLSICFICCLHRYCSEWYFIFCGTRWLDIKGGKHQRRRHLSFLKNNKQSSMLTYSLQLSGGLAAPSCRISILSADTLPAFPCIHRLPFTLHSLGHFRADTLKSTFSK